MEKKEVIFNHAEIIGSFICDNDDAGNDTVRRNDVGGTDLGISINDYKNNRTFLLFGDTFSDELGKFDGTNNWRSGVIAVTTDYDLSDNLKLDGFWTKDGFKNDVPAENPLLSLHESLDGETTKIYTGGIIVNDAIYAFYMSRVTDDVKNTDVNNYGGCIKSVDGGITWKRVPDLTWVDHAEGRSIQGTGNPPEVLQKVVNLDIDKESINDEETFDIDMKKHEAYHFTQIFPIDGGDGYIYVFGRGGYGFGNEGIKLGRVKKEGFENFDAYEYLTSVENQTWDKDNNKACFIVKEPCRNLSVVYNKFAKKWVMSYFSHALPKGNPICVRCADDIAGVWSEPQAILFPTDAPNLYGAYLNERWVENDGETFYFVYSRWNRKGIYRSYIGKCKITIKD
ncbi:MAG: DUF4185 domain-containing protein [Clostridia bacterium]|nr:DUF4185 domain-containing protein [Clostridia bacterium]